MTVNLKRLPVHYKDSAKPYDYTALYYWYPYQTKRYKRIHRKEDTIVEEDHLLGCDLELFTKIIKMYSFKWMERLIKDTYQEMPFSLGRAEILKIDVVRMRGGRLPHFSPISSDELNIADRRRLKKYNNMICYVKYRRDYARYKNKYLIQVANTSKDPKYETNLKRLTRNKRRNVYRYNDNTLISWLKL